MKIMHMRGYPWIRKHSFTGSTDKFIYSSVKELWFNYYLYVYTPRGKYEYSVKAIKELISYGFDVDIKIYKNGSVGVDYVINLTTVFDLCQGYLDDSQTSHTNRKDTIITSTSYDGCYVGDIAHSYHLMKMGMTLIQHRVEDSNICSV